MFLYLSTARKKTNSDDLSVPILINGRKMSLLFGAAEVASLS
jgi:hypothetical protein